MKKTLILLMTCMLLTFAVPAFATIQDVNVVPPPVPSAPVVTVSGITDTEAHISWPAVASATQYTVYLNSQTYAGTNNPASVLTGLIPHTDYTVYVTANNAGGDSPASNSVNFTTLSPAPVAVSEPLVQTNGTTATVKFNPLAVTYNITAYNIYLDGKLNTSFKPVSGMQTANITGLSVGSHTVTITATNDNQEGPQSQPITFTVSTVPTVLGVQAYNKSSDTIWLNWQEVPGASSYDISLNGQSIGQTYQPSYIVQNLTPNTSYQISIMTVMPDGEQSTGTTIIVQTEPLTNPMSVSSIENYIFTYVPDIKTYLEILFAVIAALLIAQNLKLTVRH
jgi:hypothetical protein